MTESTGGSDVAFSIAPWGAESGGKPLYGHSLEISRRDPGGRWEIVLSRRITHPGPAGGAGTAPSSLPAEGAAPDAGPLSPHAGPLSPDAGSSAVGRPDSSLPAPELLAGDPIAAASREFQDAAREAGIDGALRAYARNTGFVLMVEGEVPMGLAAADRYWKHRAPPESWSERELGGSADAVFGYRAGEVSMDGLRPYVQIWQFDPKVANWGLRVLLISSGVSK